jgi:hypothetical protein
MSAFIIAEAVPPLSLQRDGAGWTIWDALKVVVLRTPDGDRLVPTRREAECLLPGGAGAP